jgi:hypothetical protein
LAESIKFIYEETPETPETDRHLKDIALKFVGDTAQSIMKRLEFVKLCKETTEIYLDILKATLAVPVKPI